jgi:hypothetical protein
MFLEVELPWQPIPSVSDLLIAQERTKWENWAQGASSTSVADKALFSDPEESRVSVALVDARVNGPVLQDILLSACQLWSFLPESALKCQNHVSRFKFIEHETAGAYQPA